jgi:hypothetical protein
MYLLQEQQLNHSNHSRQKINMGIFVQSTEHDMHIYPKIGDANFYVIL